MSNPQSQFPETRWTLIDAVRDGSPSAFEALSQICEIYWYPVYAFFRDQGKSHHDAQDLTQGFFASLLRRDDLATVDQAAGNFRAFLSASARHFAISEYWRSKAAKRGGGMTMIQFDEDLADRLYRKETLEGGDNPQVIYDKRWARAMLDGVLRRLREEAADKGSSETFDSLQRFLEPNTREVPMKQVAKSLKMTEGAVRVEIHRIRKRYGDLLGMEIGKLVEGPEAVKEEISYLLQLVGRAPCEPWLLAEGS